MSMKVRTCSLVLFVLFFPCLPLCFIHSSFRPCLPVSRVASFSRPNTLMIHLLALYIMFSFVDVFVPSSPCDKQCTVPTLGKLLPSQLGIRISQVHGCFGPDRPAPCRSSVMLGFSHFALATKGLHGLLNMLHSREYRVHLAYSCIFIHLRVTTSFTFTLTRTRTLISRRAFPLPSFLHITSLPIPHPSFTPSLLLTFSSSCILLPSSFDASLFMFRV